MKIQDHPTQINPTSDQEEALKKIEAFFDSKTDVFILKGYAGTGKTTLIKAIAEFAENKGLGYRLAAPTGRAAKVLNEKVFANKSPSKEESFASTIHSHIYNFDKLEEVEIPIEDGNNNTVIFKFSLVQSSDSEMIYIIDEASMVSDQESPHEFLRFGSGRLLKDLFKFTRLGNPAVTNKVIFIGDPAQLPPVGMNYSPALKRSYLKDEYGLQTDSFEMVEIVRQKEKHSIIDASIQLRDGLKKETYNQLRIEPDRKEIFNTSYNDFLSDYKSSDDDKIVIAFKNATVRNFNGYIREEKYGQADLPVQSDDKIVVSKNNQMYNLMNGEFCRIINADKETTSRVIRFYDKGGEIEKVELTWRRVSIEKSDLRGNRIPLGILILENFLNSPDGQLTSLEQRALYIDFKQRNPDLDPGSKIFGEALQSDKWFNALLIKYGYAVTCHKAQGGEWNNAFVIWDFGSTKGTDVSDAKGKANAFFYRWSYTAITRAIDKLYCLNAPGYTVFSNLTFIPLQENDLEKLDTPSGKQQVITDIDHDIHDKIQEYQLDQAVDSIKNHFISLSYVALQEGMKVTTYKRVGYEIRYSFSKGKELVTIKFWVNGDDEITGKWAKIPSRTNSEELFEEVEKAIAEAQNFIISLNDDTLKSSPYFKFENVHCEQLFEQISDFINSDTRIANIEHLPYKERYHFVRGQEKVKIDFEYNKKGRYGRAVPISSGCNSKNLLESIEAMIMSIKKS